MRDLTRRAGRGRRRGTREGRHRGLGRAAARAPARRRQLGRRRVLAGLDRHDPRPGASCRLLGLDPAARRRGGRRPRRASTSAGATAPRGSTTGPSNGFFEGEVEPCINGNVVATGAYFGAGRAALVDRLLGEQLADGGWNCEDENGATVSSFGTTINVLEGLLEYERATGGSADVTAARRRGEEYLLERGLLRRKSTGEVIDPTSPSSRSRPGGTTTCCAGSTTCATPATRPDDRVAEAIDLVEAQARRRWPLGARAHLRRARCTSTMDEGDGQPSRWNTLRAMRVLRWADRAAH